MPRKNKFNTLFKDFLGRDWIDINNASEIQFVSFCHKHSVILLKKLMDIEVLVLVK